MKHLLLRCVLLLGVFLTIDHPVCAIEATQRENRDFTTYFHYDKEAMQALADKDSSQRMSSQELRTFDAQLINILQQVPIFSDRRRIYAYLYTAQREGALLSYQVHGDFIGSLTPLSTKVVQLFIPSSSTVSSDDYSETLADIVFKKIKERFDQEKQEIHDFPTTADNPGLTKCPKPPLGLEIASWKPWILNNPTDFMATPPPPAEDPIWKKQAELVKEAVINSTPIQKSATKFWAGDSGPESGSWLHIANEYMFTHKISFPRILCVRALMAQAGVDADISIFYSKYTYLIPRPITVDPTISEEILCPKHPSYPSGHSTISHLFALILSQYFPEVKQDWLDLAEEASQSRLWGGIHFPMDLKAGWALGENLAEAILDASPICEKSS